jgi:hypothetical protein
LRTDRIIAASLLSLAATAALAQPAGPPPTLAPAICPQPSPPPPQSLRPPPVGPKPVIPNCVDQRTMMAHCKPSVLTGFNAQVSRYNLEIQARSEAGARYVEALNAWTRDAAAYANCEVAKMNAENPPN